MDEDLILIGMKGTTYTFTTQCPPYEEFQKCHQILLSDEYCWDLYVKIFHISAMNDQRRYGVGTAPTPSQNISSVNLNSNSLLTPVAETQDDINIHDFD